MTDDAPRYEPRYRPPPDKVPPPPEKQHDGNYLYSDVCRWIIAVADPEDEALNYALDIAHRYVFGHDVSGDMRDILRGLLIHFAKIKAQYEAGTLLFQQPDVFAALAESDGDYSRQVGHA